MRAFGLRRTVDAEAAHPGEFGEVVGDAFEDIGSRTGHMPLLRSVPQRVLRDRRCAGSRGPPRHPPARRSLRRTVCADDDRRGLGPFGQIDLQDRGAVLLAQRLEPRAGHRDQDEGERDRPEDGGLLQRIETTDEQHRAGDAAHQHAEDHRDDLDGAMEPCSGHRRHDHRGGVGAADEEQRDQKDADEGQISRPAAARPAR